MMVSTKGRYALRVMIDLAEHYDGNYISMKSVAERQEISLKYMEKILPLLVSAKFIEGVHGRGGGYRLIKDPKDCLVGDILRQTEGSLAPVACLGSCSGNSEQPFECKRTADCRTLPLWAGLDKVINEYLDSVTLADLMKK